MTLFSFDLAAALISARQATDQLGSTDKCSQASEAIGQALSECQGDVLEANTRDLDMFTLPGFLIAGIIALILLALVVMFWVVLRR